MRLSQLSHNHMYQTHTALPPGFTPAPAPALASFSCHANVSIAIKTAIVWHPQRNTSSPTYVRCQNGGRPKLAPSSAASPAGLGIQHTSDSVSHTSASKLRQSHTDSSSSSSGRRFQLPWVLCHRRRFGHGSCQPAARSAAAEAGVLFWPDCRAV